MISLLKRLFGNQAVANVDIQQFIKAGADVRNDMYRLVGRRLNLADENACGGLTLDRIDKLKAAATRG